MLSSMTGYGCATFTKEIWQLEASLRCLNSRSFDCTLHLPRILENKEYALRKELSQTLVRGKVVFSVQLRRLNEEADEMSNELPAKVNETLFGKYLEAFSTLAKTHDLKLRDDILFRIILNQGHVLRSPEMTKNTSPSESLVAETLLQKAFVQALNHCKDMQAKEGIRTAELICEDLSLLEKSTKWIEDKTPQRNQQLEDHLRQRAEAFTKGEINNGRWEQELFFFLERMDFSEEKNRLIQHISFFKKCLNEKEDEKGKRLTFICQEIGRELNTLGIKSHHAGIQQEIVEMKSALERVKEQLHNVR